MATEAHPTQFVRVGQVAKAIGLSEYQVRKLCDTGLIESVFIQGQRSVPLAELHRLEKEGPPLIPRELGAVDRQSQVRRRPDVARHVRHRNGRKLPPRTRPLADSDEQRIISENQVVITANQAVISRNKAEKRKADRELEEAEDWFRQRSRKQAEEEAERQRRQKRSAWTAKWIRYAVDSIPDQARGEYEPAVVRAAKSELAAISPDDDDPVVQSVMDATVRKILRRFFWMLDAADAAQMAKETLPSELRNHWSHLPPTEWEDRAVQAAIDAICNEADLGNGEINFQSTERMEEIAINAGARVVAEYHSRRQAQAESERRRRVKDQVAGPLYPRLDRKNGKSLDRAIDSALTALPPDADEEDLIVAVKTASANWSLPLQQADERERRRQIRESVISGAWWEVRQLPADWRDPALAAVRQAIEQADPADQRAPEQIRDQALKPHLDAYERRRQAEASAHQRQREAEDAAEEQQREAQQRRSDAESRVDGLLPNRVESCLRKLRRSGYPDDLAVQWKVRDAIREQIVGWGARITNLSAVSDESIGREIERAARDYVEDHIPRRVA